MQGFYFRYRGSAARQNRNFPEGHRTEADLWLGKTVGVMVAASELGWIVAGVVDRLTPELILVAAGSALGLLSIKVTSVAKRVIPPIYPPNAFAEGAFILVA